MYKELKLPLIEALPDKICTPERFGRIACNETVQLSEQLELPINIVIGEE